MSNPFAAECLSSPRCESDWSAKLHQSWANYYWYEAQGYSESAYQRGECDANYKPMQTMMMAAYRRHTDRARALRNAEKREELRNEIAARGDC